MDKILLNGAPLAKPVVPP